MHRASIKMGWIYMPLLVPISLFGCLLFFRYNILVAHEATRCVKGPLKQPSNQSKLMSCTPVRKFNCSTLENFQLLAASAG